MTEDFHKKHLNKTEYDDEDAEKGKTTVGQPGDTKIQANHRIQ